MPSAIAPLVRTQLYAPLAAQGRVGCCAAAFARALNDWLADATTRHPPPAVGGRRVRIRYIAQTKTRPPTFVAMCSRAAELPDSYKRYLINGIREAFNIPAVPIRLIVKKPDNPYVKD